MAERSAFRRGVEALDADLGKTSIANSFVSNLSQFATGMLGAGKVVLAARIVPGVGAAVGAAEATRRGSFALEAGKAAAVGAVAFDPHGARMSDLMVLHGATWLQNPVTDFLARSGNQDDTAALGRVKNAVESIGLDVAFAGMFAASLWSFAKLKAYRAGTGSAESVEAANAELARAVAHKDAKLAASKGDLETVERLRGDHPEAVAEAELALRGGEADGTTITLRPDGTAEVGLPELSTGPAAEPAPIPSPGAAPRARDTAGETIRGPVEAAGSPAPEWAAPQVAPLDVTDAQLARLVQHAEADTAQLLGPDGWDGAIARGYRFGDGGKIPWQKLSIEEGHAPGQAPLDLVIRRVSDQFAGDIAAARGGDGGGGVMSDALQDRLIAQRVAVYGDDPAELMGRLQLAGANARNLVADVAAADLVTLRASTDAQNLAARIRLGALEEFGGDLPTAMRALRDHYRVAASARAESSAIVANAARTLRRQRSEFAYTLEDVAAMDRLSDAKMLALVEAAGRDPAVADRLLRRGFWSAIRDDASFLYVNNLLWGLRTHFVNFVTNTYMVTARPLERMIGGAVQGDARRVADNARQYAYLAGTLSESWRDAVRAWQTGDSILAPHASELSAAAAGRSMNWVVEGFKPATSIPNVLSNAYTGFMKGAGLPTRALGAVDELVKQVVYRSKVMAEAHGGGIEAGLEGAELAAHVRRTLNAAFDDAGRATDLRNLHEAEIATFQQDLLPNTVGAWAQAGTQSIPALRFVMPFVKTPTNVLRTGWKMTPILNMGQKEYRQMIRGEMGPEMQAQAIGQSAMGSMFLGVAGLLAHAGYITGGGPSDPALKRQLMATGWQPYSFVSIGPDGAPTYTNFGRFDPIAMPFGIMADIVNVWELDRDGDGPGEKVMEAVGGVFVSLVKQFGQKTYLTSLNDTLSAIFSPEDKLGKSAGQMAANFVPFSSGLRFVNPDPLMRETRGVVDRIMATVPGLSERLPARRDVFGDPLTVHRA